MRRTVQRIVTLLPALMALALAAVGLLPLPGSWDEERLSWMVAALLAVSAAGYLHVYFQAEREQKRADAFETKLDALRAHVATLRDNTDLTNQLQGQLDIMSEPGRNLSQYAGRYMLTRLDSILNKQHFKIQGGFFFQDFYREVFRDMPPYDLIATAAPTRTYFWRSNDLNTLFRDFIARGGTLKRIFFVEHVADMEEQPVLDIMRGQVKAGVEVYWIVRSSLRDAQFMIADSGKTFGWRLETNADGQIDVVDVSWNPQTAAERYNYLHKVLHHDATKRFTG